MTTTTNNNDHNTTANTCSNNHNNENNDDNDDNNDDGISDISSTAKGSIRFKYLVLDILRQPDLHLFVCMVRDILRNH